MPEVQPVAVRRLYDYRAAAAGLALSALPEGQRADGHAVCMPCATEHVPAWRRRRDDRERRMTDVGIRDDAPVSQPVRL